MTDEWNTVSIEPLILHRTNRLANMYVLSPYVWREGSRYHLMVRAVPRRDDEPRLKMSEIWHGVSDDGREFTMDIAPAIFPGLDLIDLDGCEDPTVRRDGEAIRIWYTGYNDAQKVGRLLLARGPDVGRLAKAGLAIDSGAAFANPKESTVAAIGHREWRMFFEYAHDDASLIGSATSSDLDGPWQDMRQAALRPRENAWDCWHLSPGPIIDEDTARPIMFYNGATQDAHWRIGWAAFDERLEYVVDRSTEPLIAPNVADGDGSTDIAFAASAIRDGDDVLLYFSQSDQDLRVARVIRR